MLVRRHSVPPVLLSVYALFALVIAACGSDPIDGAWQNVTTGADGTSSTLTLTFNGDHTGRYHSITMNAASATVAPGCTTTQDLTGYQWSSTTSGGVTTLSFGTTAVSTWTRSGCTNPTDDNPTSSATGAPPMGTLDSLTGPYTITNHGNTLTITNTANGTTLSEEFTRQ
jgi:hypothetical protein